MGNNAEEPKHQLSKAGQPLHLLQQDKVAPSSSTASCNKTIDNNNNSQASARPPLKNTEQFDDETANSKEVVELSNTLRHDESAEGIVIDGLAFVTPIKMQRPIIDMTRTPETHNTTVSSKSTTSSITEISELSTIQKAYRKYTQTSSKKSSLCGGGGKLQDIIEDVQFCGMYFWGELFDDASGDENNNENNEEKNIRKSKGERMKEMENTFIGKLIQCQCGNIDNSGSDDDVLQSSRVMVLSAI